MPSGLGNSTMDPKERKILGKGKPGDRERELDGGHRVNKGNYF
jgi:hypothetical protein